MKRPLLKKPAIIALSLLVTTGLASTAVGGDAAAGKAKSLVCAACHGANGISTIPTYPNLAGQNKGYLISAMKAYKNKQRTGGMAAVMVGQVAALSDSDIENLAEYYSTLK